MVNYLEHHYTRCAGCLLRNYFDLYPCTGCTQLMFCSKTCEREAWKNYHEIECPVIEALIDIFNSSVLGLRVVLRALKSFKTMEKYVEFANSVEGSNRKIDPFSLDYRTAELSAYSSYKPIHTLELGLDAFLEMLVATSLTIHLILKYTKLKDIVKLPEHKHILISLLYRNLQVTSRHSIKSKLDRYQMGDSR